MEACPRQMKKQLEAVIETVPHALPSATQPPLPGTSAGAMVGRSVKGTELAEPVPLRSPRASLEDA